MFDNQLKDRYYQHLHSEAAQAIQRQFGKTWVREDPRLEGYRPPGHKRRKVAHQAHAKFRRTAETQTQDAKALGLRETFGYSYQRIADAMGWDHRQRAQRAVQRARDERLVFQYGQDKPSLAAAFTFSPRVKSLPPVKVRDLFPRTTYSGKRKCGCWLPGRRVNGHWIKDRDRALIAYVDSRQWCAECALERAGLTWSRLRADPSLIRHLDVRPREKGRIRVPAGMGA